MNIKVCGHVERQITKAFSGVWGPSRAPLYRLDGYAAITHVMGVSHSRRFLYEARRSQSLVAPPAGVLDAGKSAWRSRFDDALRGLLRRGDAGRIEVVSVACESDEQAAITRMIVASRCEHGVRLLPGAAQPRHTGRAEVAEGGWRSRVV